MSGVWEPDEELARIFIGADVDLEQCLKEFNSRIRILETGKWFIVKFIGFQWGKLSNANSCHRGVFAKLSFHGIEAPMEALHSPFDGAKEKGKEKDQEKAKDKDKDYSSNRNH